MSTAQAAGRAPLGPQAPHEHEWNGGHRHREQSEGPRLGLVAIGGHERIERELREPGVRHPRFGGTPQEQRVVRRVPVFPDPLPDGRVSPRIQFRGDGVGRQSDTKCEYQKKKWLCRNPGGARGMLDGGRGARGTAFRFHPDAFAGHRRCLSRRRASPHAHISRSSRALTVANHCHSDNQLTQAPPKWFARPTRPSRRKRGQM